jgi:hypothetical protein
VARPGLARRPGGVGGGGAGVGVGVGADQDVGEAAQMDGDGLVGDGAVRVDEAAQRVGAERFEVLDRFGGERGEAHGEALGAQRDPYVAEVGVGGASFPQARGPYQEGQFGRVGVAPGQSLLLAEDLLAHLLPHL